MSAKISLVPEREMYYNRKTEKQKRGNFPMQENGTELLVCCTGCQSCMPCMVKINIPGLFALYNRTATEGVEAVRAEYERQDKRADDCINCYRCEKQCPQHLGIGILMQDIAETFEEWKNRHLCNLKKNSNLSIKYFGKNWTYLKNLI